MSLTSYPGYQRLVRDLITREATTVLLQEGRQLVRHGEEAREVVLLGPAPRHVFGVNLGGDLRHHLGVYAGGSGGLGRASLDAYNEVHFVGTAISHRLASCPKGIDALSKPHSERQRLRYILKACLFFEGCKLRLQYT